MKLPFSGKSKLEAQLAETTSALVAEKETNVKLAEEILSLKNKIEELSKVEVVPSAEVEALKKQNETLQSELVKASEAITAFEAKVTAKAMDIVAAQGIPALPVVHEDKTQEEIMAQLAALPESQRFAFYQKHSSVIKSELLKAKYQNSVK